MKCYLCNDEKTSIEHSPAKCFFPKNKRLNLITVPSCAKHNLDTSLDDEYVRNLVAMTKGNNQTGLHLFKDKGNKSLKNSHKKLTEFTSNLNHLNFIKGNDKTKNLTFLVDIARFDKIIKKIAYGLHYYKFSNTWQHRLLITSQNFITVNHEIHPIAEIINSQTKLKQLMVYEGSNPDVFKFSFYDYKFKTMPHKILAMQFYEWFEVWAIPIYDSDHPSIDD